MASKSSSRIDLGSGKYGVGSKRGTHPRKGHLAQEPRRASIQASGMQKFMTSSSMFKINHYSKKPPRENLLSV